MSVTKASLKALQQEKPAQASLVRIYATVRHFARWLHRKFPGLFPLGCPTEGVKPPAEPTANWKGLTRIDEIRLTAAAQTLRAMMQQPSARSPCVGRMTIVSIGLRVMPALTWRTCSTSWLSLRTRPSDIASMV